MPKTAPLVILIPLIKAASSFEISPPYIAVILAKHIIKKAGTNSSTFIALIFV